MDKYKQTFELSTNVALAGNDTAKIFDCIV